MASANNAKKGANVRMKRKERKNIAAGQAHIQSTAQRLRRKQRKKPDRMNTDFLKMQTRTPRK